VTRWSRFLIAIGWTPDLRLDTARKFAAWGGEPVRYRQTQKGDEARHQIRKPMSFAEWLKRYGKAS
jgi:hypothetical protein